jgi:heme-degrading monooxygenase HmoA
MVLEVATLDVAPDQVDRFLEIAAEAREYLSGDDTPGFGSFRLLSCEEVPNRFVLHLTWKSTADHEALSVSDYGQRFGGELMHVLAGEPSVEHYRVVTGMQLGDIDL